MTPSISAALRAQGFTAVARDLDRAGHVTAEITALRLALATVDGAAHVLRSYARSLRNTRALEERMALRIVEERIVERLGSLMGRAARNVQGSTP